MAQKNLGSTPRTERLALVEREELALPLTAQAELLNLSRSSLYYQAVAVSAEEIAIKHRIDAIYTAYPFYGSRRIQVVLNNDDQIDISRQRVQRYMREMGIAGICPGPNLSRRAEHRIYPYLLRGITAGHRDHIWGVDIVNAGAKIPKNAGLKFPTLAVCRREGVGLPKCGLAGHWVSRCDNVRWLPTPILADLWSSMWPIAVYKGRAKALWAVPAVR